MNIFVEILMDLVDLNLLVSGMFIVSFRRDPYGSRGSKYLYVFLFDLTYMVEILMDLVDLNM